MRTAITLAAAWIALAAAPVRAGIIEPWLVVVRQPAEPASVYCTPAGGGRALAQAVTFGGFAVDATIEIILLTDYPGIGEPIVGVPREDIWLGTPLNSLVPCIGASGLIPDADTDAEGRVVWTRPLAVGGACDPDTADRLFVYVNGSIIMGLPSGLPLFANSADINGDLVVNLADVGAFVGDLTGVYRYRSDFNWDGVVNIVDVGWMVQALGTHCP